MAAPYFVASASLALHGAQAPDVWTLWHEHDGTLSVVYNAGPNQSISFVGTPQEVRLALAKGLAAIDRAEAAEDNANRPEEVAADAAG